MMPRAEILRWLHETDEQRLESLWTWADAVRRQHAGDAVHLRGLIEVSNHCVRRCLYCGLRADEAGTAVSGRRLQRYRLTPDEVLHCARQALSLGYGTVVLQAGEDPALTRPWVADVVRRIKRETGLAVTLSLGEQDEDTLCAWHAAGADRYLLRFETSNRALFDRIHPPRTGPERAGGDSRGGAPLGGACPCRGETSAPANPVAGLASLAIPAGRSAAAPGGATVGSSPSASQPRLALLRTLRALGYEVGSGVMIGIPGQTYDDLADDIALFCTLDLDMIGVGPWLPHPDTPLGASRTGRTPMLPAAHPGDAQVPNTELMTYKVVALARLVCPRANIPSTTALATLNRDRGRELGLLRGANVVMPNLTPPQYRRLYEVYPAKACNFEEPSRFHADLVRRIRALGREVGTGPGTSPNWRLRAGGTPAPPIVGPAEQTLAHRLTGSAGVSSTCGSTHGTGERAASAEGKGI